MIYNKVFEYFYEGLTTIKMFVHLAYKFTQNTQNLRKFSYTKMLSGQPLVFLHVGDSTSSIN